MYRLVGILSVAAVLSLVSVDAQAADPLRDTQPQSAISQSSLAAMGLGSMQTMTRAQSSQIQGQGGIAWGSSTARWNGFFGNSVSQNSYVGWGGTLGAGANASAAGNAFGGVWAGGFSIGGGF